MGLESGTENATGEVGPFTNGPGLMQAHYALMGALHVSVDTEYIWMTRIATACI